MSHARQRLEERLKQAVHRQAVAVGRCSKALLGLESRLADAKHMLGGKRLTAVSDVLRFAREAYAAESQASATADAIGLARDVIDALPKPGDQGAA